MADNTAQSFAHHTRWDPFFHFFFMPVTMITFIWVIVHAYKNPSPASLWLIVVGLAAIVGALKIRLNPLKAQDRIIRLEERLRLATLAPEKLRSRIGELTEDQLVGLRFASDAEVAGLAERAINEKLSKDDIKKAIVNWRADNFRV